MKKGIIWCWLFGHLFRFNPPERQLQGWEVSKPSDYCRKCGLSKKELGI